MSFDLIFLLCFNYHLQSPRLHVILLAYTIAYSILPFKTSAQYTAVSHILQPLTKYQKSVVRSDRYDVYATSSDRESEGVIINTTDLSSQDGFTSLEGYPSKAKGLHLVDMIL